jgi:hypothetical protein
MNLLRWVMEGLVSSAMRISRARRRNEYLKTRCLYCGKLKTSKHIVILNIAGEYATCYDLTI